jgi:hypothetical protein
MQLRYPWEPAPDPAPPTEPPPPKRRGRRPASAQAAGGWRYHHLTVSGPAGPISVFAEAARGAGIIPWVLDGSRIEEDVFNLAASQPPARRNLTMAGCHVLARQFRERVEARQARAAALVGRSRACPFDLHALLPVPAAILALGPAHPAALAWLSEHWGAPDGLRQVAERSHPTTGRRLAAGHRVVGYSFFAANATPAQAVTQLGARWPALRFMLQQRSLD